ncbi:hypothetical protein BFU36_10960 [Sulfolobus sp. A20]|uniref:DUF763 domain-containing protein n=2 Tax=Sulfolobaceae TaxID=118883 RepID=UPI0008462525|nr:DUF763 domain-containing protein [Sulfolobus sp. A20]TRM78227.1 DUF763 domain-containing protein [Sulfolobus sp. B5]TRM78375.1 DUF763 domain-containing protein [Sulfolobus sp. A20-N-F8]TRM82042.1 DUF763 domain-containing protein [Sulfolobus sp. A20-N-F6]TRM85382.1 DUF763 domain-containing protein [Sulfolobus sp. F3]TRM89083.1 DUF763 domain-containing protein [Sulfolobus sp. C3]TRM94519.1 DUF763 domain-containing protein [Sulfolobus sp. A20-N-G8]TRN02651.1 DUF763 domain-containing protein 
MEVEGIADLPLHTGHVPSWLVPIMKRLSKAIIEVMLLEWGPEKVIERFSNPLWFQGFNNAIGMDWDSSGSTTVTLGILKDVVKPEVHGFAILGGKGSNALKVQDEIDRLPFDVDKSRLKRISKIVAKVDTTLVQDGHQLYHHSLLVTEKGNWGIVQQGMNLETKFARRYHWKETENFVVEPHSAIAGVKRDNKVINIIERNKDNVRKLVLDLLKENPKKILSLYKQAEAMLKGQSTLDMWVKGGSISIISKEARLVYMKPVDISKIQEVLSSIYEAKPLTFEEALINGLGPSTARALYLIADLIYNEPPSYKDPVNYPYDPFKYAFAVGGKDGIPFPVNRRVAWEVIYTLEDFISKAKLSESDKRLALSKLRELGSSERA